QQRPLSTNKSVQKSSAAPDFVPMGIAYKEIPEGVGMQGLRQTAVLDLQRTLGNAVTQQRVRPAGPEGMVQRVVIGNAPTSETLHNTATAAGDYSANTYTVGSWNDRGGSGNIQYDMTRSSSGVNVNVRIKFVATLGTATTDATALPAGQPRTFARNMCQRLVRFYNNKFILVGQRRSPRDAGVSAGVPGGVPDAGVPDAGVPASPSMQEVRLPLNFRATPVFDVDADSHSTVHLNTATTATGASGAAINAQEWFTNKNNANYPASFESIYAHEYGHLIGLADEYSLSNPNMHALFHDISPTSETQMNNQLDKAGIREMVLAAIRPRMLAQIQNIGSDVALALEGQQAAVARSLATGLRQAWREGGVIGNVGDLIRPQLEAAGQTRALRMLNQALRFEATGNLSNITIAKTVAEAELVPGQIQQILNSTFNQAASSAQQSTVTIPYQEEGGGSQSMDVSIDVGPVVSGASSPLNAAANQAATASVGQPAAMPPGGRRRVPLYPSDTLIGRLTQMPGQWQNVSALMDSEVTQMGTRLEQAVTAALASSDISTNVNDSVRQLYRVLYDLVNNVSTAVTQQTLRAFLSGQIRPLMERQVNDLMGLVEAEVDSHQTASGTGTNAAPNAPVDPQLAAAVRQMEQRSRQMLNPATPAGGGTPNAPVRFTTNTLMGDNDAGTSLRPDQMQRIAANFNANIPDLRHNDEEIFDARRTS
ncbi:MAG: hypothetical protein GWP17_05400, partial [Aquificales bacterium]|nr:hypothetical protein [Aquificales bacterium]